MLSGHLVLALVMAALLPTAGCVERLTGANQETPELQPPPLDRGEADAPRRDDAGDTMDDPLPPAEEAPTVEKNVTADAPAGDEARVAEPDLPNATEMRLPEESETTPPCAREPSQAMTAEASGLPPIHLARVAQGLGAPIAMVGHPTEPHIQFVMAENGIIWRIAEGSRTIFLNLGGRVDSSHMEQGILDMAFHPSFQENGLVYVSYTPALPATPASDKHPDKQTEDDYRFAVRLVMFHIDPTTETIDPNTEQEMLFIRKPEAYHNAGMLQFGMDCMLYFSTGDGGAGDRAPEAGSLLGKILRIGVHDNGTFYAPADNPFVEAGGHPFVWQTGLRNPWRMTIDQETGDMYVADVGSAKTEEINYISWPYRGGQDFGWPSYEGSHQRTLRNVTPESYTMPIHDYNHTSGPGESTHCAVIGGHIYRGLAIPALTGSYLFGDFCSGTIWRLWHDADGNITTERLLNIGGMLAAFGQGADGETYIVDWRHGTVSRLTSGS